LFRIPIEKLQFRLVLRAGDLYCGGSKKGDGSENILHNGKTLLQVVQYTDIL
jgi:hypothetical protein